LLEKERQQMQEAVTGEERKLGDDNLLEKLLA